MTTSATRVATPTTGTTRARAATSGGRSSAKVPSVPRILRDGVTVHGTAMVLRALPGDTPRTRGAVVASRKIGNAVTRNRAKRRLREALRLAPAAEGLDVVLIARVAALSVPMETLTQEIRDLTARAAARLSQGQA